MGTDGRTDGRTNGKLFSKVGYHTISYPYKRYDTLPYKRHEVAHTMSQVLPGGGALHVDRETSFFAADLWMWGVTVRGLSQGYLSDIVITRCPCIAHLPTFHLFT